MKRAVLIHRQSHAARRAEYNRLHPGMPASMLEQNYVRPDRHERGIALGEPTEKPFDLNDPEVMAELKRALVALAQYEVDPFRNADPATEMVWKQIVLEGPYADAWDGASADEYITAISRYASEPYFKIVGPYFQLGGSRFGRYGIVGGPQPTAAGLEVIAGAVNEKLGGTPKMERYLAWRGGMFAPPSQTSGPPATAVVIPSHKHGPFWQVNGYTPIYPEGDPTWVAAGAEIDDSLVNCWQQLADLPWNAPEATRALLLEDCIATERASHDQAARQANKTAPTPTCPPGQIWDSSASRCRDGGVIDLPEDTVVLDVPGCVAASMEEDHLSREQAEKECMEGCVQFFMDKRGRSRAEAEKLCGKKGLSTAAAATTVAVGAVLGVAAYLIHKRHKAQGRPLTANRRRRRA